MEHLVELLEESDKITKLNASVDYNKIKYDPDTDSFLAAKGQASRYRIEDGQRKAKNPWVVFDREAAALSPDVSRGESGGINHPIIALALQTLRTAQNIEDMPRLALGLGTYEKEYLAYFSNGADEPVVLLSYLVAHLRDEHFFNHELRLFALSPDHAPCIASGLKLGSVSRREETDAEAEPVYGRTDHRDSARASGRDVCGRSVPQARDLGCDI